MRPHRKLEVLVHGPVSNADLRDSQDSLVPQRIRELTREAKKGLHGIIYGSIFLDTITAHLPLLPNAPPAMQKKRERLAMLRETKSFKVAALQEQANPVSPGTRSKAGQPSGTMATTTNQLALLRPVYHSSSNVSKAWLGSGSSVFSELNAKYLTACNEARANPATADAFVQNVFPHILTDITRLAPETSELFASMATLIKMIGRPKAVPKQSSHDLTQTMDTWMFKSMQENARKKYLKSKTKDTFDGLDDEDADQEKSEKEDGKEREIERGGKHARQISSISLEELTQGLSNGVPRPKPFIPKLNLQCLHSRTNSSYHAN